MPDETPRLPISQRAGTVLTEGAKVIIFGPAPSGDLIRHGILDTALRIYQTGSEKGRFTYPSMSLVTLPVQVWDQIKDRTDALEFIDHSRNIVYTIPTWICKLKPVYYSAGIGPRVGWPVMWFEIRDGNHRRIQRATWPQDAREPGRE